MNIRNLSVTVAATAAFAFVPVAALRAQEASVTTTTAVADPVTSATTTTTSTTNTAGTIQEFVPGSSRIVVRTSSGSPVAYSYSKKTTFVDTAGNVVKYDTIRSGEPTTVYYAMEAGQPVVSRVVVNRTVAAVPVAPATTTATVVTPVAPMTRTTSETTTTTTKSND